MPKYWRFKAIILPSFLAKLYFASMTIKSVRDISIMKVFRNMMIKTKSNIFALKIQGILVQNSKFFSMIHEQDCVWLCCYDGSEFLWKVSQADE